MGVHFVPDAYTKVTFEKRWDSDGRVFHNCIAHGGLTAKTPYIIIADEYGPVSAALCGAGKYVYVAVPTWAVDSGDSCWLQIGGYLTNMVTTALDLEIGHGLTLNTSAIADIGADYTGAAGEFASATVAGGAVSVQTVMLVPERIITI